MSPAPVRPAVLVLGASGAVGRAVVAELLGAGHPVVAVSRDADHLERLAAEVAGRGELQLMPASLSTEEDGAALARRIEALRWPLAGVVDAMGGPLDRGRLLDRDAAALAAVVERELLPHFVALRQLLPLLGRSRRGLPWLTVVGPFAINAWAGYGHLSVAAAALRMMLRAVGSEAEAAGVRVQTMLVDTPLRSAREDVCQCAEWPPVEALAAQLREALENPAPGAAELRFAWRKHDQTTAATSAHGNADHARPARNPASEIAS